MTSLRSRDGLVVAGVALVARIAVVVWGASRFPPAADGVYYEKIAARIADGHGYTWLWPDGAVTYAAHYPVGYPALVALGYLVFGAKPVVAMALNALLGAAGAAAGWTLARRATTPRLALAAGLVLALHPALLPYTAAVMTEGVTASLLTIAAALAAETREASTGRGRAIGIALLGITMGVATLVRPQSLALAPVLGLLVAGSFRRAIGSAAAVTALALAMCAPWTARNCARMDRCALVSVNGGWNLAIGTQTDSGGWQEITVPNACKTVFQEAAKDACFGHEALAQIAAAPLAWAARAPMKLHATFDYFGAAPWYLHTSNPASFPYRAKVVLGAAETLATRLLLVGALAAVLLVPPARRLGIARRVLAGVGLVSCVLVYGWVGYVLLAVAVLSFGRDLVRAPVLWPFTAVMILATALTHAVFFGSGRYGLVVLPFVTLLAFSRSPFGALRNGAREPMLPASMPYRRSPVPSPLGDASREESPSSKERDAG